MAVVTIEAPSKCPRCGGPVCLEYPADEQDAALHCAKDHDPEHNCLWIQEVDVPAGDTIDVYWRVEE